jgi:hypothetical protein
MKKFAKPDHKQLPPKHENRSGKVFCPPAQMYRAWLRPALAAAIVLLASCSPTTLQPLKAYRLPDGSKISAASHVVTIYNGEGLITIYPKSGRVMVDSVKGGAK